MEYEQEQERLREEEEQVVDCVGNMTKDQLQQALLQVLFIGPEWQHDKVIREYVDSKPFGEHDEALPRWLEDIEDDENDDEDEEPLIP